MEPKVCIECKTEFMPTGKRQKLCPACRKKHKKAVDEAWRKKQIKPQKRSEKKGITQSDPAKVEPVE